MKFKYWNTSLNMHIKDIDAIEYDATPIQWSTFRKYVDIQDFRDEFNNYDDVLLKDFDELNPIFYYYKSKYNKDIIYVEYMGNESVYFKKG